MGLVHISLENEVSGGRRAFDDEVSGGKEHKNILVTRVGLYTTTSAGKFTHTRKGHTASWDTSVDMRETRTE